MYTFLRYARGSVIVLEKPDIPDRYAPPEAKWRKGRGGPHQKRA